MEKQECLFFDNKGVYAIQYIAGKNENEIEEFLKMFGDFEIKVYSRRETDNYGNPILPLSSIRITPSKNGIGEKIVEDGEYLVYHDDEDQLFSKFSVLNPTFFKSRFEKLPKRMGDTDKETGIYIPSKSFFINEFFYYTKSTAFAEDKVKMPYPVYTAMGMAGEVGEYADKIKKLYRDNNGEITDDIRKELLLELGDVLWYLSEAARAIGSDIKTAAELNVDKIVNRFKNNTIHGNGDNRKGGAR